jgi:hypothetical protein
MVVRLASTIICDYLAIDPYSPPLPLTDTHFLVLSHTRENSRTLSLGNLGNDQNLAAPNYLDLRHLLSKIRLPRYVVVSEFALVILNDLGQEVVSSINEQTTGGHHCRLLEWCGFGVVAFGVVTPTLL